MYSSHIESQFRTTAIAASANACLLITLSIFHSVNHITDSLETHMDAAENETTALNMIDVEKDNAQFEYNNQVAKSEIDEFKQTLHTRHPLSAQQPLCSENGIPKSKKLDLILSLNIKLQYSDILIVELIVKVSLKSIISQHYSWPS